MKLYRGRGLGDFYYSLLRDITTYGRKITVRGHDCLELPEPVAFIYTNPGYCWMNIPQRKFNPFFALAEVYWILTGRGDIDWIAYYNKRMRDFNDGGPENHGAYGLRIREWSTDAGETAPIDQIEHVVRKLKADSFSRQAVIALWDPIRDNLVVSKDYPCNNLVYYSLRDGILDQTVVIRSNDVVWGTPVNAIQFTHLHALVAGKLGVKMGEFTYFVQNLHYYYDVYKETLSNLLEKAFVPGVLDEPGALCIPNFDTVTEGDLNCLSENVKEIYGGWLTRLSLRLISFRGSGYWNQTIPQVLWIHRILKEGIGISMEDREYVAERILTLGSPLTDMILDFLGETKIELRRDVLQICQRLLNGRPITSA